MTTMTIRQIAAHAGLAIDTVRSLNAEARKARAKGTANDRTMPAPSGRDGSALIWERDDVTAWLEARAVPARRGAVPKQTLLQAIKEIERGRPNAALRILKGAL